MAVVATRGFEFNFEKLNESNYITWRINAKASLTWQGAWESVEPGYGENMTAVEDSLNDSAVSFLLLVIENPIRRLLSKLDRAKDMWKELFEIFADSNPANVTLMMKDLYATQLKSGESMVGYLDRVGEIYEKLAVINEEPLDEELAHVILLGLPQDYNHLVHALKREGGQKLSKIMVVRTLLHEEKRRKLRNSLELRQGDSGNRSNAKSDESHPKIENSGGKKSICWLCYIMSFITSSK